MQIGKLLAFCSSLWQPACMCTVNELYPTLQLAHYRDIAYWSLWKRSSLDSIRCLIPNWTVPLPIFLLLYILQQNIVSGSKTEICLMFGQLIHLGNWDMCSCNYMQYCGYQNLLTQVSCINLIIKQPSS